MSTAASKPRPRVFFGWYVVAPMSVIATTTSGLAFHDLSILPAAMIGFAVLTLLGFPGPREQARGEP